MIEKNIALPPRRESGKVSKYPIKNMEVGDSILIEGQNASKSAGVVGYWRNVTGFTLISRSVEGGTRVWRIA